MTFPAAAIPPSHGASVESLRRSIEALVAERLRLRIIGASPTTIERNRVEIVRTHWQLSSALIEARAA